MIGFRGRGVNLTWFFGRLQRVPVAQNHVDSRFIPWSKAGLVVLAALGFIIFEQMLLFDADMALWARTAPEPIRYFFELTTDFGKSNWILLTSGVALIVAALLDWSRLQPAHAIRLRHLVYDLSFLFYCTAVAGLLANLTKNLIGRARPKLLDSFGHLHFQPAEFDYDFASFPSGHSTTFGALSMALALRFPRLWPVWLLFGIAGGSSRVMVGAHYPSDAIAGLLFGAAFTWLTARWLAQRGIMFSFRQESPIPRRRLPRFRT